tara:strand:- start:6792 stop:7343 length:552 start_codon:yes stop_codon:yes gene_type:complete
MHKVYLSLGSNLGNRKLNLSNAITHLSDSGIIIESWNDDVQQSKCISSVYETEHWSENLNEENYPNYFNIVCKVQTLLDPNTLLKKIKSIEKKMGRNLKNTKNSPRQIDIDILFFDDIVMDEKNLIIPHPRLIFRAFVLIPLFEIAPDFVHPIKQNSVNELLEKISFSEKSSVRKISDSIEAN